MVAIFATLGSARTLSDELQRRELFDTVFGIGFLLSGVAIVLVGVRRRPTWAELGTAVAVAAAYLMALSRVGIPEERTHLFEYGVVALLLHEVIRERIANGGRIRAPALTAIAGAAALGTLDELVQIFVPARVFDPVDIAFNVVAAVMAVASQQLLRWVSGRQPESVTRRR